MLRTIILLFVFSVLPLGNVFASSIPLNGLSIRLVPKDETVDVISAKTVQIAKAAHSLKVVWYSLVKDMDEEALYPTFKIKARKGMIEVPSMDLKPGFFQPSLWGMGYTRVDTALPMWVDPALLELKGRQKKAFNVGLLRNNKHVLKMAPDELFENLSYFQNLFDQYVQGSEIRSDVKMSKRLKKQMLAFVNEFFFVRKIAKTKAQLYVNQKKDMYPASVIGNEYYSLVVLDDPLNPLVIHFQIHLDEFPGVFKKIAKELKSKMEFQITQLSY